MNRRVAIAVAAMLAASCAGGTSNSDDSSPVGSTSPVDSAGEDQARVDVDIIDDFAPAPPRLLESADQGTPTELALARADNDGQLPTQVALDLLSSVLGPIPGADPRFTSTSVHDGTMALNAVRAHWDELTPEQIDAIQALLAPRQPQITVSRSGEGESSTGTGEQAMLVSLSSAVSDDRAAVMELVGVAESEIAGHVGRPLGVPIVVEFISGDSAIAFPRSEGRDVGDSGESFEECVVQLPPWFDFNVVAHEVFHCFQYAIHNFPGQDWIIEGSAEWAGARVGGVGAGTEANFVRWLDSVDSLFAMGYEAIAYYWTIETMGADPWAVIVEMLDKRNTAAVAASGLDSTAVLHRMSAAQWRNAVDPEPVDAIWDFGARDVPQFGARGEVLVTPDSPLSETATRGRFGTAGPYVISLEGSIVEIDITAQQGSLQFFGKDLITFEGGHNKRYCLTEAACACSSDEELERGSDMLAASSEVRDGGAMTYSIVTVGGDEFPDGSWAGELVMSATEELTLPDATASNKQLGGPFNLTVVDGLVTEGAYSLSLLQRIETTDGFADAIGTLVGTIVGCASAPQLVSQTLQIDGTVTTSAGVKPLTLTQTVEGPGGSLLVESVNEAASVVTGRLPNELYLDYMRSVGVGVNDFAITFTATATP